MSVPGKVPERGEASGVPRDSPPYLSGAGDTNNVTVRSSPPSRLHDFRLLRETWAMLVIGLTGGIATGKSSVSKLLKEKKIQVVDADILAREVVLPGTPALKKIIKEFGEDVLLENGTLDRKKLGTIIFNDEAKRKKLNAIVHPAVRWAMLNRVMELWVNSEKYVVLDIPLLVESKLWRWMGMVAVVYCSPELQLQRLMARDNSTEPEARSRLNSQLPIADKIPYADVVIDNSGTPKDLADQVESFVTKVEKDLGHMWWVGYLLPPIAFLSALWVIAIRNLRASRKKLGSKKRD